MKVLLSSPINNTFVRAAASGFLQANMLHEFYTSVASFPGDILDRIGSFGPLSEIRRRQFDPALKLYTRTWPWLEVGRQVALKAGFEKLVRHETGFFCLDAVFQSHDKYVASKLQSAYINGVADVYAYDDMALFTFIKAKQIGLKCIYELPIAYWEMAQKLLDEEIERQPEWSVTITGAGVHDSPEKMDRKFRELELADVVIVPGEFVKDSLPTWADKKKVVIAPFGTPSAGCGEIPRTDGEVSKSNKPLRVLFAGSLSQRKGLGDLFSAIRLLNNSNVELVVLGPLLAPLEFYKKELPTFTYEPVRGHEAVLALMRSCDVFCLPSIVEGRALVMQEAMSQGLPLIITPNTGGTDLIQEGRTGFLVPIRSPEAIAEKINWFLENRKEISTMGKYAQEHAVKYTWGSYQAKLIGALSGV